MDHKFVALDGLRGLAAVIVVWLHVATMLRWPTPPGGYLCVDLFFLLSGFVIPYAYEAKLRGGLSRGRFLAIRLIRLYPLYILGCAISLVPYLAAAVMDGQRWVLREPAAWLPWAVAMLPRPMWVSGQSFLLNPPAWSLFLELVVNIAYVVALPRLSERVLVAAIAVSAVVLGIAAARYGSGDFGTGGPEMLWALSRVTCPFAIGVLLFRRWRAGRLGWRGAPFVVPAALFMVLVCVPLEARWAGVEAPALVAAAAAIVVLAIGCRPTGRTAWWCEAGGLLSYPLYALHIPVLIATAQLMGRWGIGLRAAIAIGLPLAVVLALLATRFYDVPVRTALSRRLRSQRPAVVAVS